MKKYIYECWSKRFEDHINIQPPSFRYKYECSQPTETEAIKWLEDNGGGMYKNILHGFQMKVK